MQPRMTSNSPSSRIWQ